MKCRHDIRGVSPVIGVLLMVSLTVSLSGVVYLTANSYMDMADGGLEIISIDAELFSDGIEEVDAEGAPTGFTYSGLRIDVMRGSLIWENYRIMVDNENVYTLPSNTVVEGAIPDGNSEPAPSNHGSTRAGGAMWFSEEGFRSDLSPLRVGETYVLKVVNLETRDLVWRMELTVPT